MAETAHTANVEDYRKTCRTPRYVSFDADLRGFRDLLDFSDPSSDRAMNLSKKQPAPLDSSTIDFADTGARVAWSSGARG